MNFDLFLQTNTSIAACFFDINKTVNSLNINNKEEQIFNQVNRVEKAIAEQGFEVKRMDKDDIKRFLAIYFGASMQGEFIPDIDGKDCFDEEKLGHIA